MFISRKGSLYLNGATEVDCGEGTISHDVESRDEGREDSVVRRLPALPFSLICRLSELQFCVFLLALPTAFCRLLSCARRGCSQSRVARNLEKQIEWLCFFFFFFFENFWLSFSFVLVYFFKFNLFFVFFFLKQLITNVITMTSTMFFMFEIYIYCML